MQHSPAEMRGWGEAGNVRSHPAVDIVLVENTSPAACTDIIVEGAVIL